MKDTAAKLSGLEKRMNKNALLGDYKSLQKDMQTLQNSASSLNETVSAVSECIDSFDDKGYFTSGDFTREMLDLLKEKGLDVQENNPNYEVFPTKIRVNAEDEEVILGKKKVSTMRPSILVDMTSSLITKLNSATFNATSFAQDLENAYLSCILNENEKAGAKKFTWGTHITLVNCYKAMTPLSRSRKDYDELAFAFDLARLYREYVGGNLETKSGRRISFGTGRGKPIRILDSFGQEQLLCTVSFV